MQDTVTVRTHTDHRVPVVTHITRLTAMNTRAVREHWSACHAEIRATTVTFHAGPDAVLAALEDMIAALTQARGGRGHPVQSLHAIARRIRRHLESESTTARTDAAAQVQTSRG